MQLARRAADTGSEGGLNLLGEMLDRAGRLDEAERCYRQTAERYDNRLPLLAFLLRHRDDPGANRYRDEADRLVVEVFPAGLQPAKASVASEAPTSGITLVRSGYRAAQVGLRLDDVVVALDGLRVANLRQYHVGRHDDGLA